MSQTNTNGKHLAGTPQFRLGQIVATPAALDALARSGETVSKFIKLHVALDPGCLDQEDQQSNLRAVAHEGTSDEQERVFSAFKTSAGDKVWVITEADRSSTCVLLPEDY
jgi:hypothetical protein